MLFLLFRLLLLNNSNFESFSGTICVVHILSPTLQTSVTKSLLFSCFVLFCFIGKAIWTKHVRNGKELPEIGRDNNYDFNFQVKLLFVNI